MPLVLQYSVSPQSPRDLYTRRGFNWTERYPRIVNALLLPIWNLPPPTDLCRDDNETDCGIIGSAEPFGPWRRPISTSVFWTETMIELPEVREGGMSGRIE